MYYEDEIYHSAYSDGYSDGYYAGMELYHADDEMTEEERRARRRRRRRNVALGVAGAAGVAGAGVAGYAIGRALRKRGRGIVPTGPNGPRLSGPRLSGPRPTGPTGSRPTGPNGPRPTGPRPTGPTGPRLLMGPSSRLTGPTLKRVHVPDYDVETPNGWDFKRNKPTYASDEMNERIYRNYKKMKKNYYDPNTKRWTWTAAT